MHDDTVWQGRGNQRYEPGGSRDPANRDVPEIYEFGPFRLEPAERKLLCGGEVVALTPKAFDTLYLLVRNSGRLIEKEDLIRMLWPDTFVEEGSLSNNIFLLRKALGEDVAYIETIPKRGYRFIGAVRQLPKPVSGSREKGLPELELANKITADEQRLGVAVPALSSGGWAGRTLVIVAVTVFALLVVAAGNFLRRPAPGPDRSRWVQLTNFPDSVTQPALFGGWAHACVCPWLFDMDWAGANLRQNAPGRRTRPTDPRHYPQNGPYLFPG
jgi:DNA-binding winged helix-turn-helix (wHTH) protein